MSDRDDLRLNELRRYRKTSSRLALEVHSHCEVPAGCGGAVLRWRRPDAPVGISLFSYVSGSFQGPFLDGKAFEEQRMMLAPGEHVLSFIVDKPGNEGFLLMRANLNPHIDTAQRHEALSQADGHWRAATREPPEGWQLPGFDSPDFVPLVEKKVPEPKGNDSWIWQSLQRDAKGLGLPSKEQGLLSKGLGLFSRPSRAWVRWSFRLGLEGFS
jgi:hypothetical protein